MDEISAQRYARKTMEMLGIRMYCVLDPITDSYHAMQFVPETYELVTIYEPSRPESDRYLNGLGEQARPQIKES